MTNFTVGQNVVITLDQRINPVGHYDTRLFREGSKGVITRVTTHKALVRFGLVTTDSYSHAEETIEYSAWVPQEFLAPAIVDPNAPKPRAIGEVPEGAISPDDPGLAWFWEDAEKLARKQNYCSQYDTLTAALGAPGRKRNFHVSVEIAEGIDSEFTVKARSKKLATEAVLAALKAKGLKLPANVKTDARV
jgi:hypothetical protein